MTSLQKKKKKKKKKNVETPKITRYMLIPVHFSSILVRSPSTVKSKKRKKIRTKTSTKYQTRQGQNIYIRPAPMSWDELTFCSSGFGITLGF